MKLLYLSENQNSATSFYRGSGILKQLSELFDGQLDYDIINLQQVGMSWSNIVQYDIAWFERPASQASLNFAKYLKRINIPFIVDYDDAVFNIPEGNSASQYFTEGVKDRINIMLLIADKVVVSTDALKDNMCSDAVVINNCLNLRHLPDMHSNSKRLNYVYWRGTDTHADDLYHFKNELFSVSLEYSGKFVFHGYNPHFLTTGNQNCVYRPMSDIFEYFQQIKANPPKVIIVPLQDNIFNRCKSNIAALEGIYFGATVIAPDFPELQIPGVMNYKEEYEFEDLLRESIENKPNENMISWKYICENYNLEKENLKRKELILDVVNF